MELEIFYNQRMRSFRTCGSGESVVAISRHLIKLFLSTLIKVRVGFFDFSLLDDKSQLATSFGNGHV